MAKKKEPAAPKLTAEEELVVDNIDLLAKYESQIEETLLDMILGKKDDKGNYIREPKVQLLKFAREQLKGRAAQKAQQSQPITINVIHQVPGHPDLAGSASPTPVPGHPTTYGTDSNNPPILPSGLWPNNPPVAEGNLPGDLGAAGAVSSAPPAGAGSVSDLPDDAFDSGDDFISGAADYGDDLLSDL